MADRREQIIAELRKGSRRTVSFFRGLTPEQLAMQVYADGAQWTARQVLAHLITIEKSMHALFQNILDGGPGSTGAFDIDRYNRTQPKKLDGLPMEELISRFTAVRGGTIDRVAAMAEQDLDRSGLHPFHGRGSLERFIRWAYEHAALHEADIRAILARSYGPKLNFPAQEW